MTHSNIQNGFVTKKHIAKDDDLDFIESPFYWQNCNPSTLTKTWHGFLSVVGNENDNNICDNPDDKTEFESEIKTSSSVPNLFFSTTPVHYSIIFDLTNEVTTSSF